SLTPFDRAEDLTTAEAVPAFLADAEATADPAFIEHAHQVAARARTMHGIASCASWPASPFLAVLQLDLIAGIDDARSTPR
ncbi:hypothetical protein ACPTIT_31905, partial [Pseudomonas aeruginosa]